MKLQFDFYLSPIALALNNVKKNMVVDKGQLTMLQHQLIPEMEI